MEDIIKKFSSPSVEPELANYTPPTGADNITNPNAGVGDSFTPSPYWELYKNKLPNDQQSEFKLPENLTKENEQELLDSYLSKVYSKEPTFDSLHPLAREIQERSKGGDFDINQFIADKYGAFNLNNYTDDEILFASYKERVGKSDVNPNGFDDEQIKEELSKINSLDKRQIANNIRQEQSQRLKESYSVNNEELEKGRMNAYLKEVDENINFIFKNENERGANAASIRTFAGLDIGESNFQAMKDEYKKLVTPDANGVIPLSVKLQDPYVFFKLAMIDKYEDFFKSSITKARNEGKEIAINQLPHQAPNIGAGVGASNEPMSIEETKRRLSAPSGSI